MGERALPSEAPRLWLSCISDSRIIRRIICESMLSTKMQKLLQCTVALVNSAALRALCFFLNKLAHNTQGRPWPLVSILALPHDV